MTLKFLNGYWTVFSGPRAVMSFPSLERAFEVTGLCALQVAA